MATLGLTADEVLSTTRAVRKRLDLDREVARSDIEECVRLAQQAPTSRNSQTGHFVVVTDPARRAALAELYNRDRAVAPAPDALTDAEHGRMMSSADYLRDHLHEVPVHVIPCVEWATPEGTGLRGAGPWGSILQAAWSFMLAARARGLGTVWTTLHLRFEPEAAELLAVPYPEVRQAALIPVAHTKGLDFRPAPRMPLENMLHWDAW